MNARFVGVALASLLLATCARAPEPLPAAASNSPAPAPAGTDLAASVGKRVQFQLGLVAGDRTMLNGETQFPTGQSWNDAAGNEHSIAPATDFVPGPSCIFVVVDEHHTPLLPLQPVVIDLLKPCDLESSYSTEQTAGVVQEVRPIQLLVNGQPATLEALVLGKIQLITPPGTH